MNVGRALLFLLAFSAGLMVFADAQAVTTLGRGVTLGDWLAPTEWYHIQTTRYTKAEFENIKALGFDHVRILVNFNTSGITPEGTISPIQIQCLEKAVQWAEEVGLKVVITNSGDEISDATADAVAARVAANWKDLAGRFAGKAADLVLYEIFSAPADLITAEAWNAAAKTIIAAIRQVDTQHTIVVGPVMWYSIDQLANLEKFADDNILYAVEMWEPVLFTRQNTTFHKLRYYTINVPFPYDPAKMPPMASEDGSTAAGTAYQNYPTQGTVDWVKARIDQAADIAAAKGMPLWCAAMGAITGQQWDWGRSLAFDVPAEHRAAWFEAVRTEMEAKGIGWSLASYRGNYGFFDNYDGGTGNWMMFSNYPYDVNKKVAAALGLNVPDAGIYVPSPLKEGVVFYDDEFNPMIRVGWWLGDGEPNFFVTDSPVSGKYCMGIYYPSQYNAVDMFFPLYQDMAELADKGYVLDFFIRCDNDQGHIQARFEMTNEFEEDRPWRMNYHIDNSVVPFDGEWQRFTMALTDLQDMGAWDPDNRTWYGGPGGQIDWGRVQRFQFVSETRAQPDVEIYIDRVRVVDPATLIREQGGVVPGEFALHANYPNPFNPSTTISYTLAETGQTTLAVYNVRGEKVAELVNAMQTAGDYAVQWNGRDMNGKEVPSGIYFYRLKSNNQERTRRMVLMR
ncbi:MAG: cellulase family glycosylhydrolase [candidate division KSB1 bacterium]|nr:cellulase family glycosylhydrolase [candidate division KSB1 bacterium]